MEQVDPQTGKTAGGSTARVPPNLLSPQGFLRMTSDEVQRANRYDRPFSAALVLVDGLSLIRKAEGMDLAEVVMTDVATRLIQSLRGPDRTGRLGFAQLGCLLPESGPRQATTAMERMRDLIERTQIPTPKGTRTVTLSVGIASLSPRMRDPKAFLMAATFELRRAQSMGGNRVCNAPADRVAISVPRSAELH